MASARPPAPTDAVASEGGCCLLMTRLGRASGVQLAATLAALGMHPHEFAVLKGLDAAGALAQGRLAEALRVHPSNLVAVIDGLEAQGLVLRRRDPGDRRRYLVELTPKGRRRLDRAEGAAQQVEEDLLAPLNEAERSHLRSYLTRLAAHACAPARGAGRSC
jgi:DNA-binding MarR family transcriptional regulator